VEKLEAKLREKNEVIAELLEEHVALKKVLGRTEETMVAPGNTRRGCGFCEPLVGSHGVAGQTAAQVAGTQRREVPRLAQAPWAREPAQRSPASGLLGSGLGKSERVDKTIKYECIRLQVPLSLDDARRLVARNVGHYNNVRLHSSIGYVAPAARLAGRHIHIFSERRAKLVQARTVRQNSTSNLSTSTMN
jgi:hypothetical protein